METTGSKRTTLTAEEVEFAGENVDSALVFLNNASDVTFTEDEDRSLVRKVDWMLLPLLAAVYMLQFVDKNLINFANIMGLGVDTGTSSKQFTTLAWSYWVTYLLSQPLAGYVLQKLPVAKVLGWNVTLWGVVVALNCVCKNYASLLALRIVLGIFESCVSPSMIIITAMWYKRQEQPLRFGIWGGTIGIGIFADSLCSYGLLHYHGKTFRSWQIMFLVFGLLTIVIGLLVVFFLPDNPMTCKRLTEKERVIAIARLQGDTTGIENRTFKTAQVWELLVDSRAWMMFTMNTAINIPNAAVSTFQAAIITSLGFSPTQAALLSLPSGAVGIIGIAAASYSAYRFQTRSASILGLLVFGFFGTALLTFLPDHDEAGRLVGVYLTNLIPTSAPIVYSWVAANFAGHTKKTMMNALIMMSFCLGNALGPLSFTTPPAYWAAKVTMLATLGFAILVLGMLVFSYRLENNKRARHLRSSGDHDDGLISFMDLTDRKNKKFVEL
ncbi:major facilitator superfamily transporter [Trichoderma gamsii]|uniref:Major facilitator superfamily transporter n=1 Tax=Trichoderma gamsii TaxID=398673 RepID=A0A2P5A324_9HYPO|nr:major facilitator superfamily transporter [Trichoderma gamsii]PON30922.1 major facilitator superfamily transporter [Trichoderma gamsii]